MRSKKRNKNSRNIFLGCVIIVLGIVMFASIIKEEYIPHSNSVDTEISQYSDKHITPNAIAVNPGFKEITFNITPKDKSFFSSQPFDFAQDKFASVIKTLKNIPSISNPKKIIPEYGIWVWTPIMQMTPEYIESILSGAKADKVNVVYISIDSYLDIFVMAKGKEQERQKQLFSDKLEYFINSANQKGIAVDAEAGWQNWAEPENTYKAFVVVNYVKNFNDNHQKSQFRGFQYDVEPYMLATYKKDKATPLKNFIELIDQTENFLSDSDLKFSVVIPDFYDKNDQLTPRIWLNDKKDFAFAHLLNILDRRSGNTIIVMSYRNFAEGKDGSIEISNNEMRTAKKGAHQTKIIIAQETGEVLPPYITFHDTSKNYLSSQIGKINTAFSSYPNFGGIAIHYANAFLALP